VNRRFATPVAAIVVVGVFVIAITWVYLLATIAYYRRRIIARPWDLVWLGVLPLGAAGFLGWIIAKSMLQAPRQPELADPERRPARHSPAC